jgi:streptogramin lyase
MLQRQSTCIALLFLTGCLGQGATPNLGGSPGANALAPQVIQNGSGTKWKQFKAKTAGFLYSAIVAGPDGNMWFIDENDGALARISMSGSVKEFPLYSELGEYGVTMAVGADGKFYIGHEATDIVRATTFGSATSIPIPSGDSTGLNGIALGPDGNVWFTEAYHIAKITPAGTITEYPYPDTSSPNQYGQVVTGSDGNVWFAHSSFNYIGRITPTGTITTFPISITCDPAALVEAKDKNVWFACLSNAVTIGKVTPSGTVTTSTYSSGFGSFNSNETEQFGARGPDGNPWFADNVNVFKVDTATSVATAYTPPLASGERPDALATGPDGNLWVDTIGDFHIDVRITNPMNVSPTKLSFATTGTTQSVTVSETGVSSWTATSSNTSVATVAPGTTAGTFNVTSAGAGSCTVTISDGAGNEVRVSVTVS